MAVVAAVRDIVRVRRPSTGAAGRVLPMSRTERADGLHQDDGDDSVAREA